MPGNPLGPAFGIADQAIASVAGIHVADRNQCGLLGVRP
jgi:hypothetical protein